MAPKNKGLTVNITPDEVLYTTINSSKDGYNSARVVIKTGDKEYLSVSCEWEGDTIPSFAMDLMGMIQGKGGKQGVSAGKEEAYDEYASKFNKK